MSQFECYEHVVNDGAGDVRCLLLRAAGGSSAMMFFGNSKLSDRPISELALEAVEKRSSCRQLTEQGLADVIAGSDECCGRATVFGSSFEDCLAISDDVTVYTRSAESPPKTAFMFTGQGSQSVGMGHQFYNSCPSFRESFDSCAEVLDPLLPVSLHDLLWADGASSDRLRQTEFAQPAIFSIGFAFASLWKSLGVAPDFLIGHSIGEIVAACEAGVMDVGCAARLVADRGRLMGSLPSGGSMLAVRASQKQVEQELLAFEDLELAAVNSGRNAVVSGGEVAIEKLAADLEEKGVACQRLAVSHAFHSTRMEPILDPFCDLIGDMTFSVPDIPFSSNVTGDFFSDECAIDPAYWATQIRNPVLFSQGVKAIASKGCSIFIEIGGASALYGNVRRDLRKAQVTHLIRTPEKEEVIGDYLRGNIAKLFDTGIPVDWSKALMIDR